VYSFVLGVILPVLTCVSIHICKIVRYWCLQPEGVLTCSVCVSKRVSILEGFKITYLVFVLCNLLLIA